MLEEGREVDFHDSSITENTRGAYPIEYIPNAKIPCVGGHPKNIVMLAADAFGVLPPVSRLTPEQAMYHFISGYTAKVAGTEVGVKEPEANDLPVVLAPYFVAERMDQMSLAQTNTAINEQGVAVRDVG